MDPLLSNLQYNYSNYDDKLEDLYRKKKALESSSRTPTYPNLFNEIEKEFEGLSNEQKSRIYSDPAYQQYAALFSEIVQAELLNFIRPRLLQNEMAVKLLEDQRDTVRVVKKQMNSEAEKRMADFKDYTENYSHITYDEYIKNK